MNRKQLTYSLSQSTHGPKQSVYIFFRGTKCQGIISLQWLVISENKEQGTEAMNSAGTSIKCLNIWKEISINILLKLPIC